MAEYVSVDTLQARALIAKNLKQCCIEYLQYEKTCEMPDGILKQIEQQYIHAGRLHPRSRLKQELMLQAMQYVVDHPVALTIKKKEI